MFCFVGLVGFVLFFVWFRFVGFIAVVVVWCGCFVVEGFWGGLGWVARLVCLLWFVGVVVVECFVG